MNAGGVGRTTWGGAVVITFRVSAEVKDDRQIVLTLPSDVPTGRAELLVTVDPQSTSGVRRPRSSLADWAEESAEHWGQRLSAGCARGTRGSAH